MKKLIVVVLLCITDLMYAQATTNEHNTVSVYGTVTYPLEAIGYRCKVDVSFSEAQYGDAYYDNLQSLKEAYFKKLEDNGIDPERLTESKLEYLSGGRRNDGTTYTFTTTDKEELLQFMTVGISGVNNRYVEYKLMDKDAGYEEHLEEGLQQAQGQATVLAKKLKKKLGDIKSVEVSQTLSNKQWSSYKNDGVLSLHVIYELE